MTTHDHPKSKHTHMQVEMRVTSNLQRNTIMLMIGMGKKHLVMFGWMVIRGEVWGRKMLKIQYVWLICKRKRKTSRK